MTREQWASIGDNEKRIVVAELRGHKWFHKLRWSEAEQVYVRDVVYFGLPPEQWNNPSLRNTVSEMWLISREQAEQTLSDGGELQDYSPDYLADLNAMHSLERFLFCKGGKDLANKWRSNMRIVCGAWSVDAIHATAAQRAEAFALTLAE